MGQRRLTGRSTAMRPWASDPWQLLRRQVKDDLWLETALRVLAQLDEDHRAPGGDGRPLALRSRAVPVAASPPAPAHATLPTLSARDSTSGAPGSNPPTACASFLAMIKTDPGRGRRLTRRAAAPSTVRRCNCRAAVQVEALSQQFWKRRAEAAEWAARASAGIVTAAAGTGLGAKPDAPSSAPPISASATGWSPLHAIRTDQKRCLHPDPQPPSLRGSHGSDSGAAPRSGDARQHRLDVNAGQLVLQRLAWALSTRRPWSR